jgi:hypothetical protein
MQHDQSLHAFGEEMDSVLDVNIRLAAGNSTVRLLWIG